MFYIFGTALVIYISNNTNKKHKQTKTNYNEKHLQVSRHRFCCSNRSF